MRQIKSNWIAEYLRFTRGNETPEIFHLWIAFSLLAATLERSCKLYQGHFDLFPNLYVIVVAGTASCHKTAAIKMGKRVMDSMENPPRIFAQKITNERLIQFLGEGVEGDVENNQIDFHSTGYIVSGELKSFLGQGAIDSGIMTTLTDLYDPQEKWKYETKGAGRDFLQNTCLNLIGASTRKWLREAIPSEALGGGFMSRTIFVYSENPRGPYAHPQDHIPDDFKALKSQLANDLDHIRENVTGYFDYADKEAKKWYTTWYGEEIERQASRQDNQDFYSRWPQFLLKTAMVLSAARNDELKITREDLKEAKTCLDAVRGEMSPVVNTISVAESQKATTKVLGIIKRRREINHQKLAKYTKRFASKEDLRGIIETLEEAGEIETEVQLGGPDNRIYMYKGDD